MTVGTTGFVNPNANDPGKQLTGRSGGEAGIYRKPEAKIVGVELEVNPPVFEYRPGRDEGIPKEVTIYAKLIYSNDNVPDSLKYEATNWFFGTFDESNQDWYMTSEDESAWGLLQERSHLIPINVDDPLDKIPAGEIIAGGTDTSTWQKVGARLRMKVEPLPAGINRDTGMPNQATIPIRAEYKWGTEPGQTISTVANFQFRTKQTGTSDESAGPSGRTVTYRRVRE